MKRRLSSLQTVIAKIIFPVFWLGGWGAATASMFLSSQWNPGNPPKWLFLLMWFVGAAFFYRSCMRLKVVRVDEENLYVSNYLREISIPLSDVYDVTENVWLNLHPVTIHLKSPSAFGDEIRFMPKVRFTVFSSHPVVGELKELAAANSSAARLVREP